MCFVCCVVFFFCFCFFFPVQRQHPRVDATLCWTSVFAFCFYFELERRKSRGAVHTHLEETAFPSCTWGSQPGWLSFAAGIPVIPASLLPSSSISAPFLLSLPLPSAAACTFGLSSAGCSSQGGVRKGGGGGNSCREPQPFHPHALPWERPRQAR